jgi:hypothetical protein
VKSVVTWGNIYVISRNITLRRRKTIAKTALMLGAEIWTQKEKDTTNFSKRFWGLREETIFRSGEKDHTANWVVLEKIKIVATLLLAL